MPETVDLIRTSPQITHSTFRRLPFEADAGIMEAQERSRAVYGTHSIRSIYRSAEKRTSNDPAGAGRPPPCHRQGGKQMGDRSFP